MNKTTLLREAEDFRDQLTADLRIVEKFIELARWRGGDQSEASVTKFSSAPSSQNGSEPRRYGQVGQTVAEAISQCKKKYNVRDIERALKRAGHSLSRLSITTALRRFTTQGKIREVVPGAGRRATVYTTISL